MRQIRARARQEQFAPSLTTPPSPLPPPQGPVHPPSPRIHLARLLQRRGAPEARPARRLHGIHPARVSPLDGHGAAAPRPHGRPDALGHRLGLHCLRCVEPAGSCGSGSVGGTPLVAGWVPFED